MSAQPNLPPQPESPPSGYAGGPEMTLIEHLKELRTRVLWCALAIVVGVIVCAYFWETILGWLLAPARAEIDDFKVVSRSPTDRISTIFKIAMYGGLLLASPVVLYQILAFIIPGLTPRERRAILPGLFGAIIFLLMGMAFAYYIVLPQSLGFLLNIGSDEIENQQQIQEYVNFVIRLVFWTGIAFELPMVLALLARFGVVRSGQLLRFWRYAVLLVFIIAAIVTPTPDPLTQTMVGGPLLLLYFVGIFLAWIVQPKRTPPGSPA